MVRIALCDDEPVFVEQISRKIKEYMPGCEIRGFPSGAELLGYGGTFDLYFLDIQMEDINGIDTARKLREQDEDCIIVFITGAKEYVFDAFDVAALHYLVKPVDGEKLREVLERAEKEIAKKRGRGNRQIFIKTRNKNITLNTADVLYFENEMRKIVAHTVKGEISFYGVMADMEKEAGDGFCRCHRGYLVNLSYVAEYDADTVWLSNGEKLYLAKDRYHDFVKQYMRYLRDGGGVIWMPDLLSTVIDVAARIMEGFCLHMLFGNFCGRKIKKNMAGCVLTIVTWFAVSKAISFFVFFDGVVSLGKGMISLVLSVCAAYLIGVGFYRGRMHIRLFLVLMFTSFTYISNQIGCGVGLSLLYGINQMAMRIDAVNNQVFIHILVNAIYVMEDAIAVILPVFSARFLVKNHRHSLDSRSVKEIVSGMMPVIMGSSAAVILYFIFFMINENGNIIDYDDYMGIYVFITVAFIIIWLAVLYSFKLQQDLIGMQEERTQKSVLENQISQMQNSMTEMECFYENVRHVKHDMKNQMEVMEKMLGEKQEAGNEEVIQYFEDMRKDLLRLEQKIHTGSAVSDAVISSKFHYAEKEIKGVHLDAGDFLLTDKLRVRAYDIGIILNNGLDNAIEAVKRLRSKNPDAEVYIKIRSFWKQKMFFIEIENSFDGEITWDKDGYPRTVKPDGRLHGIGLKNIRHCALGYMGDIDCIAKKDRFILSVMLKG